MRYLLFFFFSLFLSNQLSAQFKIKDSCVAFVLHIEAKNLPSDTILLKYEDCDKNIYSNTIILSDGRATFSGKINRATEGIIWTDQHGMMMDGPKVLRFIIEPSEMTLRFSLINDTVGNVSSTGSAAQKEKEDFEEDNDLLLKLRENYRYGPIQLSAEDQKNDSIMEKYEQKRNNKFDALNELLMGKVLKYARENPESYYSGYLLTHYIRMIPVDTLEKYFVNLPPKVIYSGFGKNFLDEIFKLSGNQVFREKFADSALFQELSSIRTIHDISLLNSSGTKTSFSQFKGNYILVDFWGSWCGPCFANIPNLKKLMKDLKNKPIQFVSVSLDKDVDNWKKSMTKHDFPGINLFDEDGLLSTFFKVLWVPRYVIIHPDGTVANIDAPQAVNPELKMILEKLLEKSARGN